MSDSLTLKWGTLKGWDLNSDPAKDALKRWAEISGVSFSAMQQERTQAHKEAICGIIDAMDDDPEIWNDWTGETLTKDEAKRYIMEYDK